jgi:P-type Ca2+ transporter type 2C
MDAWHGFDSTDAVQRLGSDPMLGLTETEAARRLAQYGPNELTERGRRGPWVILWEQFTATMVVVLLVAAVLSAIIGDLKDTIAILAIVILNATLGFTQEYRAEKAMAALKKLAVPTVRARRDGGVKNLPAHQLVPGDIVLLETGGLVPADGRLLECANLRIQEAALTGESEPVDKVSHSLSGGNLPLGDRRNMAYMGTIVTYGRGKAIVTETGMKTELGRIASMLQSVAREQTPLQRRLAQLGRGFAVAALVIVAVVFVLGLLRGEELKLMMLTAVSMAVAAVPEGLPAVVTIVLAVGARRMLKRRALIRKLPAVETLGSVTVICSDKTGTLTENRMTVSLLDLAGARLQLTADTGTAPGLRDLSGAQASGSSNCSEFAPLLAGGALCNDAQIEANKEGSFRTVGDPTEEALVAAAARLGLWKPELELWLPRIAEIPFDSERKRMTTIHRFTDSRPSIPDVLNRLWNEILHGSPYVAFTKGAVDGILDISRAVWINAHAEPLTQAWRKRISDVNDELAQSGMRVLGVALRPLDAVGSNTELALTERDLIFVGMAGLIDPARPEVKDAIETCKAAGVRPVMITGDHPLTAQFVARELGIAGADRIVTGQELAQMSVEELEGLVEGVSVFARVSPEHKLKIVLALQKHGHIVAMTGDGVNDAPALKKADIGVAMGISGTDVSKEAADMVLLDDNFATIVAAAEEGRVLYDNIRKFIKFIATTNSAEIWVMLLGPLLGMPLPLLPLQILWVNLVTDGLPALALGAEPAERDIMRRPPYHPSENVFGRGLGRHILWVGILMALVALGTGHWYWSTGNTTWQTMVFMVVIISQLSHVLAIRSWHESTFRIGLLSNKPLMAAVALTLLLQLAVVYVPLLQRVFKTVPLSAADLALSLVLGSMVFWAVELEKWFLRSIRRRSVDTLSSQEPAPDSQSASERIATRSAKLVGP